MEPYIPEETACTVPMKLEADGFPAEGTAIKMPGNVTMYFYRPKRALWEIDPDEYI